MINWEFIYELEGGVQLEGYVPKGPGHSGITVAAGIDLGQYPKAYFSSLAIPDGLKEKILPYVGLMGQTARYYLNSDHLVLTQDEADALMSAITDKFTVYLGAQYRTYSRDSWSTVPDAAQTVIASVAWQYGDVAHKCPHFWEAVCEKNWKVTISVLENFGDAYTTRRNHEAQYLETKIYEATNGTK